MKKSKLLALSCRTNGGLAMLWAAALSIAAGSASAGSIGINFVNNGDGGVQNGAADSLGAAEQAGAPGFEQVNWNNLGRWGGGTEAVDSTGVATGVKLWWDSNNTWSGGGTATPDEKLMNGYLDSTGQVNYDANPYQFWWNENKPDVYVEGLSAWMTSVGAVGYDVVVYSDGDSSDGRKSEFWLQQAAGPGGNAPTALGPDLTPHVFVADAVNWGGTYSQIPLSSGTMETAGEGNFIVFPALNSDNFILRTEEHFWRVALNGFQIVPRFAPVAPSIAVGPMSMSKYAGMKATFTVAAVGTPTLQYQWQKVGAGNIANATNSSLVLSNVTMADNNSQYIVTVSNGIGSVPSDAATLTVLDAAGAKYAWSGPTPITTAEATLNQPGYIAGAASFGATEALVTNAGVKITFTVNGSIASVTGNGAYYDKNVLTLDTGNPEFNEVLKNFNYDGGPKTITLHNLVVGRKYSVQLFGLDDRNGFVVTRTMNFQDPNDDVNVSETYANGDNAYMMATFTASATTETIKMNLPVGNNGAMNALIVRLLQPAPGVSVNPLPMTVYSGRTVTLKSVGVGQAPLAYQWRKGGSNIAGETNATLTLNNVSATASYDVVISNGTGAAISTPAVVTVLPAPPAGSFASTVLANNPIAFWRLNEELTTTNALDYADGVDGNYGTATTYGFNSGIFGPQPSDLMGFESNNGGLQCSGLDQSWVTVPALNVNTNTVTIVAWINPSAAQPGYTGIVMTRAGVAAGLGFSGTANELAYTWNSDSTWQLHSGLIVPQNQWSMVALVIEPTQGTLYMANTNSGLVSSVNALAHIVEKWTGQTRIGGDPNGIGRTFIGNIDEVAVFNHALTKEQMLSLWAAGRAAGILPPVISQSPVSMKIYSGRPATFTVAATGSGVLTYQWKKNGVNLSDDSRISGSTTATLIISNVAAGDINSYSVVVANNAGSVTSETATLDVVSPAGKAFETAMINADPLAYWRFNETTGTNAFDMFGGLTGTYGTYASIGQPGQAIPSFEANNSAVSLANAQPESWVTVPPLKLNTNTMTFAAWIYPSAYQAGYAGIFFQRAGLTVAGMNFGDGGTNLGYTWDNNSASYGWNSGLTVPSDVWVFVAMVVEAGKTTLYMGTNNVVVSAATQWAHPSLPFDRASYIGNDPGEVDGKRIFNGLIDEAAVFNRALSGEEIAQLYGASVGAVIAPQINVQPRSQTVYGGKTVQLTTAASGSGPLHYQWFKGATAITDGNNVSGATTPTLSITNVTVSDSAAYSVVVTNTAGKSTSIAAQLVVGVPTGKAYEATVLAGNPVAYWRLGETAGTSAYDYVGGLDGTYGSATTRGVSGPLSADLSGFEVENLAVECTGVSNSWVQVPALSLNTNTVSFVAWVYPTDVQPNWSGVLFTRGNDTGGICFRDNQTELGYTWNGGRWDWSSGIKAPVNQWSMITLVIAPDKAVMYMANAAGVVSAVDNGAHAPQGWTSPARIGNDPQDAIGRTAKCKIDEVAVFKYSMTEAQVKNLYTQASGGVTPSVTLKIQQVGANIELTWPNGTLLEADAVDGAWTTVSGTSPRTVEPSAARKFYKVQVK